MTRRGANRIVIPTTLAPHVAPRQARLLTFSGATMGTSWSVRAYAPIGFNAPRFESELRFALERVVREMSLWDPASDICRFNALAAGEAMQIPPAFAEVLACALAVAEETGGAFDPTLGALVDLWGFGARTAPSLVPSEDDLRDARASAGWRALELRDNRLTQTGGLALDLNGIAKGYAVDLLAATARKAGLGSYLVEIGGELRGGGVKPDGQPWWVDIEQPPGADAPPMLAALCDLAVATSGDYRRYEMVDGARVSHTLDPVTGRPLANALASVTVLHGACMYADAYATALSVMGVPRGLEHATRRDLAALFVIRTATGFEEHVSPALATMMDDTA